MIAELGHYALVLALLVALVQTTVPLFGAAKNDFALMGVAQPAATMLLTLCWSLLQFRQAKQQLSELGDNGLTKRPFQK